MAWRVEQIPAVCRIDVEKDAGDDNRFLFEKLLKERKTIIDRVREILQVQPNVKGCDRGYLDFEPDGFQALQDMITFHLEVLLESNPLVSNMLWVQKWNRCQLETANTVSLSGLFPKAACMLTGDWHHHPRTSLWAQLICLSRVISVALTNIPD
jgi:hypothetical protein